MFISKMKLSRRMMLRGMGATLEPAAARSHGAGADRGAETDHALRRDLHAARPAAGLLGAEDGRQELRVQRHHEARRGSSAIT